jgi:peptidoglycan/xylan/chitin deacetylase (PgdA/CDA1 family)
MAFAIPVLCYHALHAPGTTYAENDHVALEEDLRVIERRGFRIVPLPRLVENLLDPGRFDFSAARLVALSFDDGTDFDYRDYSGADVGFVKSFHGILEDHAARGLRPVLPGPLAVSFVIASPEARTILDVECISGRGQWNDSWWRECSQRGLIGIGNHSWDHVHPFLPTVSLSDQIKGSFHAVKTYEDADIQIRTARELIEERLSHASTRLFAYPYGHASDYLVEDYFPNRLGEHHHLAAFSTDARPVTPDVNRWNIPRFVCGEHWRTPEELEKLLRQSVLQ